MATPFTTIYNRFLGKITDDMYMELTPQDTLRDLSNILIQSLPAFEFPRFNLYDYTIETKTITEEEVKSDDFIINQDDNQFIIDNSRFNVDLTEEEINILAIIMMATWLQRQITSIENIRMKYSGADFKMTSQANHLSKLVSLLGECQRQSLHMQRLYKRRKISELTNNYRSNWADALGEGVYYKNYDY